MTAPDPTRLCRFSLLVPAAWGPVFADLLEDLGHALQVDVDRPDQLWCLHMLADSTLDANDLGSRIALLAASLGLDAPALAVEPVDNTDAAGWLARTARAFPPLRLGRFFVFGSHHDGQAPAGSFPLRVDAATAFGSGEHGTTAGCLTAMEHLARARAFRNILDLGTGTGLLAMAATRLWPAARVMASDLDPESVRVARTNARINYLGPRIACLRARGYQAPALARRAPFDLILANILTRPLCEMARDLGRHLDVGGVAVLSGFLDSDRNRIRTTHEMVGLRAVDHYAINGWSTMVLEKPHIRAGGALR